MPPAHPGDLVGLLRGRAMTGREPCRPGAPGGFVDDGLLGAHGAVSACQGPARRREQADLSYVGPS